MMFVNAQAVSIFVAGLFCLAVRSSAWADPSIGIDATNQYAWSENTGWVNAAQTNGGVQIHFNETNGFLTGYAWSENIGWIKLGANAGGPYVNDSAANWGVNLDAAGHLSGYAWSENAGWINFNPANGGVSINLSNGRFSGYAWGENIGWLKFQGTAPDYNVRTVAFDQQPHGTPNWWLKKHGVTEEYDEGDEMSASEEYAADTDPNNASSFFHMLVLTNMPQPTVNFLSSARRYYTLQFREDLCKGEWSNVVGQVSVPGNGEMESLSDTNEFPRQFYRVKVAVAP
jgi:hypothetical protein